MIGIKIKPAIELINIILSKPIPTTFNKTDEDSYPLLPDPNKHQ